MQGSDRYALLWSPVGRILPLVLLGLIWQAVSALGLVDPSFLPSPARVAFAISDLLTGREIRDNLLITLLRATIGLVLGAVAGIWLGLMMARSQIFHAYVAPIVGGTYSLPKSALIPLFILWFGIGTVTTVCAVFLACLLPMVVNTFQGVMSTPRVLVWGAEAFGTPPKGMLWRVFLPHALPDILAGLRVALGFSFVLAISSEMLASTNGIGKLIFMYGESGAYDYMFAAIGCVVVVAFLADRLLLVATERSLRWHELAGRQESV